VGSAADGVGPVWSMSRSTRTPLLAQVPAVPGDVHAVTHLLSGRLLGPYYACGGALVRVSNDVLVVLGNPLQPLAAPCSLEDLRALATAVDEGLEDIAPSKRLADELEVLHAVRAMTTGAALDLTGTLQHILDVAVQALSCEVGLLRDGAGRTVTSGSWPGGQLPTAATARALDLLAARAAGGCLCLQDAGDDPALAPFGRAHGVHSLLAVTVPAPVAGVLVVAHTSAGPRGFTNLCQQLGSQLVDAAGVVAHTASLRRSCAWPSWSSPSPLAGTPSPAWATGGSGTRPSPGPRTRSTTARWPP